MRCAGAKRGGGLPTPPFAPRPLIYCAALRAAFLPRFSITTLRPTRFFARVLPGRSDAAEDLLTGPIRGELLGAEHLAERAQDAGRGPAPRRPARPPAHPAPRPPRTGPAASWTTRTPGSPPPPTASVDVGPAGEWLLDNFHVVQEHIREVRESLPRGYYRELPELAGGPLAGYPRVYELAITLISHTEGRIELENVELLRRRVPGGRGRSTIGELWAVPGDAPPRPDRERPAHGAPHRAAARRARGRRRRGRARWSPRAGEGSAALDAALDRVRRPTRRRSRRPSSPASSHQLRVEGGALPPLVRLEQWIAEEALSAEEATARATQRLALTQVMMANSITSLRAIARMDWKTFVERQSRMEAVLREDPSGFYARMTFATRDQLPPRGRADRAADAAERGERGPARDRSARAAARPRAPDDPRQRHVGYYLVDDGLAELERR